MTLWYVLVMFAGTLVLVSYMVHVVFAYTTSDLELDSSLEDIGPSISRLLCFIQRHHQSFHRTFDANIHRRMGQVGNRSGSSGNEPLPSLMELN